MTIKKRAAIFLKDLIHVLRVYFSLLDLNTLFTAGECRSSSLGLKLVRVLHMTAVKTPLISTHITQTVHNSREIELDTWT